MHNFSPLTVSCSRLVSFNYYPKILLGHNDMYSCFQKPTRIAKVPYNNLYWGNTVLPQPPANIPQYSPD